MSENNILPCPFCGGEAEVIGHYIKAGANNFQYFVRCKKCKARPQPFYTFKKKEKAIEVWNTRKPLERIVERLEEVKTKGYVTGITANPYEFGACHAMDRAIEIVKEEGLK